MSKRIFSCFIALVAVLVISGGASAVVITFDDLESPSLAVMPSYSNSGFTFTSSRITPDAFGVWSTTSIYYNTSAALFNNYSSETTYLRADSGRLFNFEAIDLDLLRLTGTATVTFRGYDQYNTLLDTVTIGLLTDGWYHVSFTGIFTNLATLEWTQTGDLHQFDNVTVSEVAVPEPSTLLLLGSGLLGLGLARRRLKK